MRVRLERLLPDGFWVWLHQLREVEQDRRWNAARTLLTAHPELAGDADPVARLRRAEARVYSQNGEDGVVAYLLSLVGPGDRRFVEFGVEDGTECNTANLALTFGWRGLQLEANAADAARAREFYAGRADVRVVEARVTPRNIDGLLREHGFDGDLDLLSIDIDGNDYWVWEALETARPRIVVIEYNAVFGPKRSITVPYAERTSPYDAHASGWYHGASLTALARLGERKGYVLAGAESRGVNAFFVRRDVAEGKIAAVSAADAFAPFYEAEHLFAEAAWQRVAHLEYVEVDRD
jgi:hypothetical protein